METTTFSISGRVGISSVNPLTSRWPKRNRLVVTSVLTPSTSTNGLKSDSASRRSVASTPPKTVYKDNWLEHAAISYLSKAVQDTIGLRNEESGYESLVAAAGAAFRAFNPTHQRQLVAKALQNAIPAPVSFLIKTLMPPSKFSREYFAASTTVFFPWLVGPCEVRQSEIEGRKEKNIAYIKKCRFLESSNCAGMCTNLCKLPTQEFIKNSFGIPLHMVPNFDDMSCEMIFGQEPPAMQDDPTLKQPCYRLCNVKQKHVNHKQDTGCISSGPHDNVDKSSKNINFI